MSENFVFLVIFDTCDVVYSQSISLLPPIVLDTLYCFIQNFVLYAYPTGTLHIRPYPILLLYLVVVYIIIIQLLIEPILSNHKIKADFKLYICYLKGNYFQKISSIVLYSFSKTIYFKIGNSQQQHLNHYLIRNVEYFCLKVFNFDNLK